MWKSFFWLSLLSIVACNIFTTQSIHTQESPIFTQPSHTPFPAQTIGTNSSHEGNFSSIDICNFSLDMPRDWYLNAIGPTPQPNANGICPGYVLTRFDGLVTLTIKPDYSIGEAYQPCPAGTVIIKILADYLYIVRTPDPINNGFVYSNSSVLFDANSTNQINACQTPHAILIGKTFFIAELDKKNQRFDQEVDVDPVDKIIESIRLPPFQY
jgi:hypothetical protein